MSQPSVEPQGPDQSVTGNETQPTNESINPAWKEVLDPLPESLHALITPSLKKWDESVNRRFEETTSKYKPYDSIIEEVGDVETLQNAIRLMQAIESDPKQVYDLLAQEYNFPTATTSQQQPPVQPQTPQQTYDDPQEAAIAELKAQIEQANEAQRQLASYLLAQKQQEDESNKQKQLSTYLERLKNDNPNSPWDEDYILAQIINGKKPEDALKNLQKLVQSFATTANSASDDTPVVIGSSGGVPSQQVDVARLPSKDIKNIVAQTLARAAAQNG